MKVGILARNELYEYEMTEKRHFLARRLPRILFTPSAYKVNSNSFFAPPLIISGPSHIPFRPRFSFVVF